MRLLPALLALALAAATPAEGQALSQRGFLEGRLQVYPQEGAADTRQVFADAWLRHEASWTPAGWLSLAGAFDARADREDRVERRWSIDWSDRGDLRPALSVRRLSAALQRGGVRFEAGKQLVRWGKADVLVPTDRFAPRDFFEIVEAEFLPVTAARLMWERGAHTIDVVVSRFTPSRVPAAGSRWAPGSTAQGSGPRAQDRPPFVPAVDGGPRFPSRAQFGARWSHVAEGFEFSASFFDGFNHLPQVDARLDPLAVALVLTREYSPLRMYGADAAWPTRWVTLKGEVGYFTSRRAAAAEFGLYVLQLERQKGEWFLAGGYAGEFVTREASELEFSPERGLARTFLGRASYTIDANRNAAFEGAVRRDGRGVYAEAEFSQAFGQHWRATVTGTLVRGRTDDFLGQFRHNSNLRVALRWSY